ncbi:MAG: site-specific tyrosine recombinase XerD [Tissierellia bacterium]|nr:site-specific tyrosine recombinase XerD [Tissierellia bacterium]
MLDVILEDYIEYIRNDKGLSSNTLDAYIRDLKQFKEYLDSNNFKSTIDVNKTIIITYLMDLQRNGKAASTISRNLASIRCYYQYLLNENLIKEDPTLNLQSPRREKKLPCVLTKEEVDILLSQPKQNNFKGARDKAILELLYATGIRVSEMVALNLDNLDLQLGYLNLEDIDVNGRIIPIGKVALDCIHIYIEEYRGEVVKVDSEKALFVNYNGNRLTRQGFWKIIKGYTKKCNIDKKITPHTLRHSFAVHLLQNGADVKMVQEMLGHSDISTTHMYLFATENKEIKDVYEKSHPRA